MDEPRNAASACVRPQHGNGDGWKLLRCGELLHCSGSGTAVSEEDLPWVTLEVFQRSTEEEMRRQMETELDQRRLEVGIYSSLNEVIDMSSDSDGAGLFDSDED